MEIAVLEPLLLPEDLLQSFMKPFQDEGHVFRLYERSNDPIVWVDRIRDAEAAIVVIQPLPGEVLRQAKHLKFLNVACAGVDHVDMDAAKEMGIAVSHAGGYSAQAVAEIAVGMMLSLLRKVPQMDARTRSGGTKHGLLGCELSGLTVGIVGAGSIGQRVAKLLHAFGCRVLAYTPRPKPDAEQWMEFVSLQTLLQTSDIVSLHCPLTEETRGMMNRQMLSQMRQGAILINTARGAVIDAQALTDLLSSGHLAGAGVDVYDLEPPLPPDYPLLHAPNTILTPHIAYASRQSMLRRGEVVFSNLRAWLNGRQQNVVLSGRQRPNE